MVPMPPRLTGAAYRTLMDGFNAAARALFDPSVKMDEQPAFGPRLLDPEAAQGPGQESADTGWREGRTGLWKPLPTQRVATRLSDDRQSLRSSPAVGLQSYKVHPARQRFDAELYRLRLAGLRRALIKGSDALPEHVVEGH